MSDHVALLFQLLGKGKLCMTDYLVLFGPIDARPPVKAIFTVYGAPPKPLYVVEFFGERIFTGMMDIARRAAEANLHGVQLGQRDPWWRIIGAAEEDSLLPALVWLHCDSWSKKSQLKPADAEEDGFWYPCVVTECDSEGICAFQCPRLALDNGAWLAHRSRFIVQMWSPPGVFPTLQRQTLWSEAGDESVATTEDVDATNWDPEFGDEPWPTTRGYWQWIPDVSTPGPPAGPPPTSQEDDFTVVGVEYDV